MYMASAKKVFKPICLKSSKLYLPSTHVSEQPDNPLVLCPAPRLTPQRCQGKGCRRWTTDIPFPCRGGPQQIEKMGLCQATEGSWKHRRKTGLCLSGDLQRRMLHGLGRRILGPGMVRFFCR